MLQFTAKIDPKFLERTANLMPNANDCYLMSLDFQDIIRKRTLSGVDVDGKEFQEYAESTKKYKRSLGKSDSIVDLTDRSRMLGQSMQTKKIADGGLIYFADAQRREVAMIHNEGQGRMPKRTFFSISQQEFNKALVWLQTRISRRAH